MSPLVSRALRVLGIVAYLGFVIVFFVVAAYLSFSLFVRSGVTPAPDLVGLTEQEARAALADQGLGLKPATGPGRYDAEVAAGHVLEQEPRAHTLVKRGSEIGVVLSLGPERLRVPELIGKAAQAAQVALAGAGLAVGRTVHVLAPGDAGRVVAQQPVPGEWVAPSTSIDLLVSTPGTLSSYVMPDLVYRQYDAVRRFFENRGFRLGNVKFEPYEGAVPGVILRQFPLPGHPVSREAAISLVVAAPPAAVVQPDGVSR